MRRVGAYRLAPTVDGQGSAGSSAFSWSGTDDPKIGNFSNEAAAAETALGLGSTTKGFGPLSSDKEYIADSTLFFQSLPQGGRFRIDGRSPCTSFRSNGKSPQ